ncbi:hypothetical protein SAMN06265377_1770 [Flagellimonas pacifica]|uniref:Uncharacterized protein n=1 Tax=Flagellimonas pacifica TaxID=1247520 RepID=A0A285MS17_9FLAO|nr:hypothetical protein SAMN06265377_1770 [Allomuricauda parva]
MAQISYHFKFYPKGVGNAIKRGGTKVARYPLFQTLEVPVMAETS